MNRRGFRPGIVETEFYPRQAVVNDLVMAIEFFSVGCQIRVDDKDFCLLLIGVVGQAGGLDGYGLAHLSKTDDNHHYGARCIS